MHRYVSGFPNVDMKELYRLGGILFSRKLWEIDKQVEVGWQCLISSHSRVVRLDDDYDCISWVSAANHRLTTVHDMDEGEPIA